MTDAETNVFYIFYLNNDRITFLLQIIIVNIIKDWATGQSVHIGILHLRWYLL